MTTISCLPSRSVSAINPPRENPSRGGHYLPNEIGGIRVPGFALINTCAVIADRGCDPILYTYDEVCQAVVIDVPGVGRDVNISRVNLQVKSVCEDECVIGDTLVELDRVRLIRGWSKDELPLSVVIEIKTLRG